MPWNLAHGCKIEKEKTMNEILTLPIDKLPGLTFSCSCGTEHCFPMEYFSFGKNALSGIVSAASPYRDKKIFLFADHNTDRIAGQRVRKILEENDFDVQYYVFPKEEHDLFPDETSLGRILINMRRETGLFIGIGSGVINDLGKYASFLTGIPHMILATAPSMDGYVSSSSSVTCEGKKLSIPTVLPVAVIGDTDILKNAPLDMIQSGYGDILGKLTALADWKLAEIVAGEYYCETTAEFVSKSVSELLEQTDGIQERNDRTVDSLIRSLVVGGVAMSIVGLSRPASGAEHMLSHYWEMDFHKRGLPIQFHGTKVGIATPVIAEVFKKMEDCLPDAVKSLIPSPNTCRNYLLRAGLPLSPEDVGVDRDLFVRSLREAHVVRNRYSVLRLAVETGRIEQIAEELAVQYYGK